MDQRDALNAKMCVWGGGGGAKIHFFSRVKRGWPRGLKG